MGNVRKHTKVGNKGRKATFEINLLRSQRKRFKKEYATSHYLLPSKFISSIITKQNLKLHIKLKTRGSPRLI